MLGSGDTRTDHDCLHNGTLISRSGDQVLRREITDEFDVSGYPVVAYFVRNPYERLLSCYNYFYHGGLNQYSRIRKFHTEDERLRTGIRDHFPTFKDCCENLAEFSSLVKHAAPISQSIWFKCTDNQTVIEGRYENYELSVVQVFAALGRAIEPRDLPRINLSKPSALNVYDHRMKEHVYAFYEQDFTRFGYEK